MMNGGLKRDRLGERGGLGSRRPLSWACHAFLRLSERYWCSWALLAWRSVQGLCVRFIGLLIHMHEYRGNSSSQD